MFIFSTIRNNRIRTTFNNKMIYNLSALKLMCAENSVINGEGKVTKPNQDRLLTMSVLKGILWGVFDGHGKLGHLCSQFAKDFCIQYFSRDFIVSNETIAEYYRALHESLRDYLVGYLNSISKDTIDLIEREYIGQYHVDEYGVILNSITREPVTCGTTCTLVILSGDDLYTANVGDSSAFLTSNRPIEGLEIERWDSATGIQITNQLETYVSDDLKMIELTTDTPCDSLYERDRILREASLKEVSPLDIQYDVLKGERTPIFSEDGTIQPPPTGKYFNTLRNDIATLVSVPKLKSKKKIGLAMTRSMGDYIIMKHGGSHKPLISRILNFREIVKANPTLSFMLASDGIWDVWPYNLLQEYLQYPDCLQTVNDSDEGIERVTQSFSNRNQDDAQKSFGKDKDDASFILAYFKFTDPDPVPVPETVSETVPKTVHETVLETVPETVTETVFTGL